MNNWLPKSVLCLKSYTQRLFFGDLLAGITIGLVALPLEMAFAVPSGVSPEAGPIHRHRRELYDFGSRRFENSDGGLSS